MSDYSKSTPYKAHYFNPNKKDEIIKRLSENIEKEGSILELKTLNDFRNSGYEAYEYFYLDPVTNKSRQIDIVAHKQASFIIKETGTKVVLTLWIVADCKYKSKIDLLCFNLGMKPNDIFNFPKFIASDYRFKLSEVLDTDLIITSKITQLEIDAKSEHLRDDFIHSSSHQVYSCMKSLYHERSKGYYNRMNIELLRSAYIREFTNATIIYHNEVKERIEQMRLNSVYDILSNIEIIHLDAFLPAIIIDESRGILEAELDSHFQLKNLLDKEIALYKFSKGYELGENDFMEDYIFFVNRNGLTKLFKYVDLYLNRFESKFRNLLELFPGTIISLFKNDARDINKE
jgi:hypothetical protein